jgi:hypothetical protein
LPGKVGKILTWRWIERKPGEKDKEEEEGSKKGPQKPMREFFVKWQEKSYWHCDWITELQVLESILKSTIGYIHGLVAKNIVALNTNHQVLHS